MEAGAGKEKAGADIAGDIERNIQMRIGLIDVDGHNFPNIPLMKISAYHKSIGDSVEWYEPLFSGHMDKVYMSKVFSFSCELSKTGKSSCQFTGIKTGILPIAPWS